MKSFSSIVAFLLFLLTVQGQENSTAPSSAPSSDSDDAPSYVPSTQFASSPVGITASSPSVEPSKSSEPTSSDAPDATPSNTPVKAPVKAPILFPTGSENAGSDQCEDNEACADLGLTGACCPTIDGPYLDCCGGVQEDTCVKNAKCDALGLTGTCCPTAGHRRPKLNGIYLDCCDSVPDACGGSTTNRTAKQTGKNDTSTPDTCVRMSAKEFQLELAAEESSAVGRSLVTSSMMLLLLFSSAALVLG